MARFTQALPLLLALALSPERGDAFTSWKHNLRYPVSDSKLGSYLDSLSSQGGANNDQNRQEDTIASDKEGRVVDSFASRQDLTRESDEATSDAATNRPMGAYHYLLGPKSQQPMKNAAYPKRSIQDETNPMMAARSYLDRLNGPPSNLDSKNVVAPSKPAAPATGSYLDRLASDGSFNDVEHPSTAQNEAAAVSSATSQPGQPTRATKSLNNPQASSNIPVAPTQVNQPTAPGTGSYLDNLKGSSGGGTNENNKAGKKKPAAPTMGSYLDRLAGGSPMDTEPAPPVQNEAVSVSKPAAPAMGSYLDNLKGSPSASSSVNEDVVSQSSPPTAPAMGSYLDNLQGSSGGGMNANNKARKKKPAAAAMGSYLDRLAGGSPRDTETPAVNNEADAVSKPAAPAMGSYLDNLKGSPSASSSVKEQVVAAQSSPPAVPAMGSYLDNMKGSSGGGMNANNKGGKKKPEAPAMGSYLDGLEGGSPKETDAPPMQKDQAAATFMSDQPMAPATASNRHNLSGMPSSSAAPSSSVKDNIGMKSNQPAPPATFGSYIENLKRSSDGSASISSSDIAPPPMQSGSSVGSKSNQSTAPETGSNLGDLKGVSSSSAAASIKKDSVRMKSSHPAPPADFGSYIETVKRSKDGRSSTTNQVTSSQAAPTTGSSLHSYSVGGLSSDTESPPEQEKSASISMSNHPMPPATGSNVGDLKGMPSSSTAASMTKDSVRMKSSHPAPPAGFGSYIESVKRTKDGSASTTTNQVASNQAAPATGSSLHRYSAGGVSSDTDVLPVQKEAAVMRMSNQPMPPATGSKVGDLKGVPSSSTVASMKKDSVRMKSSHPAPPADFGSYIETVKRAKDGPASAENVQVTSNSAAPASGSSLNMSAAVPSSGIDQPAAVDEATVARKSDHAQIPKTGSSIDSSKGVPSSSAAASMKKDNVRMEPTQPAPPADFGSFIENFKRSSSGPASIKKDQVVSNPVAPAAGSSLHWSTGRSSGHIGRSAVQKNEGAQGSKSHPPTSPATGFNAKSLKGVSSSSATTSVQKGDYKATSSQPSPLAENMKGFSRGPVIAKMNGVTNKPAAPAIDRLAHGSSSDINPPGVQKSETAARGETNQPTAPATGSNLGDLKGAPSSSAIASEKDNVKVMSREPSPPATGSYLDSLKGSASGPVKKNQSRTKPAAPAMGSYLDRLGGESSSSTDSSALHTDESTSANKSNQPIELATGTNIDKLKDVPSRSAAANVKEDQPSPVATGSYLDNLKGSPSSPVSTKKKQFKSKPTAPVMGSYLDRLAGSNPSAVRNEEIAVTKAKQPTVPGTGSILDTLKGETGTTVSVGTENQATPTKSSKPEAPSMKSYEERLESLSKEGVDNKEKGVISSAVPFVPSASVAEPVTRTVASKSPTPPIEAFIPKVSEEQIERIQRKAKFGQGKADALVGKDGLTLEESIAASIADAKVLGVTKKTYETARENLRDSRTRTQRRLSQSSQEKERAAERLASIRSKLESVEVELNAKLDEAQARIDEEVRP